MATKRDLPKNNVWLSSEQLQKLTRDVHPLKEFRNVTTQRLTRKLGLSGFKGEAPLFKEAIEPAKVTIPIQKHLGGPPEIVVQEGDKIIVGDVLAKADNGQLSVPVHASISGTVKSVGQDIVIEK